jgi:type I site-specific restriction endonuclease
MNEAETRAEHIDPALAVAGLGVVEGSQIRRKYSITRRRLDGFGRRGKQMTADYVLVYRDTKWGVVEAKAWDGPLTLAVAQAKNYAEKLTRRPMTGCKEIRSRFHHLSPCQRPLAPLFWNDPGLAYLGISDG